MANEWDDIFSAHDQEINRDQLLKYLSGELSAEERHRIEAAMVDSDMLSDAVEGLAGSDAKTRLPAIQREIESNLKKYLQGRKVKKEKRRIKNLSWTMIVSIVILLLILIAFVVLMLSDNL